MLLVEPEITLAGYMALHERAVAFGGSDGGAYSCAFYVDDDPDERGLYGGAVGWVDAHGDGRWAVTLRCAELSDDRHSARLVAGGGIVADSDPLSELAETQAKFQAMLSAIVRP